MLNIVTGRSGSGKTQELIRMMKSVENAIYIVPEQYSFAAEKKVTHTFGISGMGNPCVYSFRRLAYLLEAVAGFETEKTITASGRVMVLHDIVKKLSGELTLFGGAAKRGEMAEESAVIITTLKQYDITKEKIENAVKRTDNKLLKKKLTDCMIISEAYEKFLQTGYKDADDVLESLRRNIQNTQWFKDKNIFIDSFTAFTPLEMKVMGEMLLKCKSVTVALCIGEGSEEFKTAEKTKANLIRLAKEKNVAVGKVAALEGAMYTSEEELKVLEKSFFDDEATVFSEKPKNIQIYRGKDEYEEALIAAEEVERLCRDEGYRYRDIVVVAREMADYEREITRAFNLFRIPLFMDKKVPLSGEPAAIFMLSAIKIISRGWKNNAVFSYMKTAFSPLSNEEADELENYCLASGVKARDWKSEEDWNMSLSVKEEKVDEEYIARINNSRRKLSAPLLNLEGKIKGKRTGRELAVAFYEFLEECNLEDKINSIAENLSSMGEGSIALRMKQVYELMIGVLESFDTAFGEKTLNAEEFWNIISAGMESVEIGIIPATTDAVCAGSIDRAKGHGAKVVIIMGAREGRFPLAPKETGIFTNADRQELLKYNIELPPDTLGKTYMEDALIYSALTCATDKLLVTYSLSSDSGTPSVIVRRILKAFPKIEVKENNNDVTSDYSAFENFVVEFAKMKQGEKISDRWFTALEYYKNNDYWKDKVKEIEKYTLYENKTQLIKSEIISARYGDGIKTSVSALEKFSRCPFSYFAQVTLGLKERSELEVTAADSGTFLHEFVDIFGKTLLSEGKSWRDIDDGYIDRKTEEITMELLSGVNKHLIETSPRIRHLFTQLKRIAKRSVTVLSEHMKKGRFEPLGYEIIFDEKGDFKPLKIDLPNGMTVKLRGRVDRADILETDRGKFVRIIDYKSGNKSFSMANIYHGFDLQLAVYLTAVCENGNYRPAGMLYFKIDDPVVEADVTEDEASILKKRTAQLKMDGLLLEDDEILEAMDINYALGSDVIPVKKKKDGSFSSASKVATEGDFRALSKYAKKTVKKLCGEILSGETSIAPVKGACDWCEMKSLCGFDTAIKGCRYTYPEKLSDKDALLKIIGENKEL